MSATPQPYNPQFDFEDWEANHPGQPAPGVEFDTEFANIKTSVDQTQSRLAEIQRDDGKLRNAIVTPDSMSVESRALIAGIGVPRGDWTAATAYALKDLVSSDGATYLAVVAHTSGSDFAADLDAGKWILIASPFSLSSEVFEQSFDGDGVATNFTLSQPFSSIAALLVFADGEFQRSFDPGPQVSLINGDTLSFSNPPSNGTKNVVAISINQGAAQAAADAVAAQVAAEAARDQAIALVGGAETAEAGAQAAQAAAELAQSGAEAAQAAAEAAAASIETPIPVASGGTGATTASNARTNLGLGTAATKDFGTAAGNLVALASANTMPAVSAVNMLDTGRLLNTVVFTESGTYNKNPNASFIDVEVEAGGGQGGGAAATGAGTVSSGGGGGAGGYSRARIANSSIGNTETMTVGQGGSGAAAGANGNNGGSSSFGSHLSATGGQGGGAGFAAGGPASDGTGGAGGMGSGGDENFVGGAGQYGADFGVTNFPLGGAGGASEFGPGAVQAKGSAGIAATNPGSGGSGASNGASTSAKAGGAGAPGVIVVREYA